MKYITLATCPIFSYGGSTGFAPIHVRITKVLARIQNFAFFWGRNFVLFVFLLIMTRRIIIDARSAITPPSFDGIDRKIA